MSKIKGVKKTAPSLTFQQRLDNEYAKGAYYGFKVAEDISITQVLDVALITLHEEMGFGPERNAKFFDAFQSIWQDFLDQAREEEKEDPSKIYTKHLLDERLKAAVPADRFEPYTKRYKYDLDKEFLPKKVKELANDKS